MPKEQPAHGFPCVTDKHRWVVRRVRPQHSVRDGECMRVMHRGWRTRGAAPRNNCGALCSRRLKRVPSPRLPVRDGETPVGGAWKAVRPQCTVASRRMHGKELRTRSAAPKSRLRCVKQPQLKGAASPQFTVRDGETQVGGALGAPGPRCSVRDGEYTRG